MYMYDSTSIGFSMYMYMVLFLRVETDLESSSNLGCYDLSKNKTCKNQNICIFF